MNDKPQWLKEISCVYCGQSEAENARLKELNREMVEAFHRIYDLSWNGAKCWCDAPIRKVCTEMLAKAEVQGE